MAHYIKAKISPGVFRSERSVSFSVGENNYNLIVDESDIVGDHLVVTTIKRVEREVIIDLPRETFTTGRRIRVPVEMVLERPQVDAAMCSERRLEATKRAERGELLPCPFCGDNNQRAPDRLVVSKMLRDGYKGDESDRDAYAYAVECGSCASVGPWSKANEHAAMVRWNTRHPPEGIT